MRVNKSIELSIDQMLTSYSSLSLFNSFLFVDKKFHDMRLSLNLVFDQYVYLDVFVLHIHMYVKSIISVKIVIVRLLLSWAIKTIFYLLAKQHHMYNCLHIDPLSTCTPQPSLQQHCEINKIVLCEFPAQKFCEYTKALQPC